MTERNSFTDSTLQFEPWIQTVTGKKFYYLKEDAVDEVDIEDIAVALSRMPRWAGHTTQFYSVAQHSVWVANKVRDLGGRKPTQLLGLLHDATEAYMCDIPKPLKLLMPQFKEIENKVWNKISKKFFGVVVPIEGLVHEVDGAMLATEARDLFTFDPIDNWVSRCPPAYSEKIKPVGPEEAYWLFDDKFRELDQ